MWSSGAGGDMSSHLQRTKIIKVVANPISGDIGGLAAGFPSRFIAGAWLEIFSAKPIDPWTAPAP